MKLVSMLLIVFSVFVSGLIFNAEFSWIARANFHILLDVLIVVPTVIFSIFLSATIFTRTINSTVNKASTYKLGIIGLAILLVLLWTSVLPVPYAGAFMTAIGTNLYVLIIDLAIQYKGRKAAVNMVVSDDEEVQH
ncbi:hypothetical protein [Pedobacter sp. SYSU D00535]|uniref:hypothetical protein n=1 Tax=Pedobacter sp. SYSU D00535 TaxID=2810308 RepID=UPI001A95F460|nr:hypothetical protein [Pedobacter sp. SYSU D00535]